MKAYIPHPIRRMIAMGRIHEIYDLVNSSDGGGYIEIDGETYLVATSRYYGQKPELMKPLSPTLFRRIFSFLFPSKK